MVEIINVTEQLIDRVNLLFPGSVEKTMRDAVAKHKTPPIS
jgi:hypothetical protein